MIRALECTIIVFSDGQFFNGVKGQQVRYTKHFKDAKIIDAEKFEGSRDERWLKDKEYKLVDAEYQIVYSSDLDVRNPIPYKEVLLKLYRSREFYEKDIGDCQCVEKCSMCKRTQERIDYVDRVESIPSGRWGVLYAEGWRVTNIYDWTVFGYNVNHEDTTPGPMPV